MKKIFTLIAAAFLALSAQAASDLTLNPAETVAFGDWEATANPDGCSITITSAVVKANSTGEVVELPFANLSEPTEGYTKDADNKTITIGKYTWASYWSFDPAILSDDYEKIVVTFAEAVPVSGLTINAQVTDDASWSGTAIGNITKDGTKATAYFSELPGASITRVGFFLDWQAETATLKIAKVELVKKVPTGINAIQTATTAQKDNESIYTLSGQRVATPVKGINIINGKKIFIR